MALALHPTQERVILHGVTWATFERLLADRGDHASVRIAYDQGTMELTMPSAEHETGKQFLVLIVDAIADAGTSGYLRTVQGLRSWRAQRHRDAMRHGTAGESHEHGVYGHLQV